MLNESTPPTAIELSALRRGNRWRLMLLVVAIVNLLAYLAWSGAR